MQSAPAPQSRSPTAAALLNLFLPGVGYIYTGIGRDSGQAIFGVLIFVFFFIGLEVGVVASAITYTPSGTTGSISPYAALIFLTFLLPFAFAYDGYRRAKQA